MGDMSKLLDIFFKLVFNVFTYNKACVLPVTKDEMEQIIETGMRYN